LIFTSVAMASTWQITTGTQFITSNGLEVEFLSDAGPSEIDSNYPIFTSNSIEFYNTTFNSTATGPVGSIGVYHDQINATSTGWINVTPALSTGSLVSIETTAQTAPFSPFLFSGLGLRGLNVNQQINIDDDEMDFSYSSVLPGSTLEVDVFSGSGAGLGPVINTTLGAIDIHTGIGLTVGMTNSTGTLKFDDLPNTNGVTRELRLSEMGWLTIRSEEEPHPVILTGVEVIFYEELSLGDDSTPIIINKVSDAAGRINFTGIPGYATREFLIQVRQNDAPGYFPRVVLIPSLLEQSTIYLVPTNAARGTVSTTIQISDQTGSYSGEADDVTIYVSKAIRKHDFDANVTADNPYRWEIVTSERVNNALNLNQTYINSDRYKVRINNAAGDSRELGAWVADENGGLQFLSVSLFDITSPDWKEELYQANASFTSNDAIMFGFKDTGPTQDPVMPGSSNLVLNVTSLHNSTHPVIFSGTACPVQCGEYIVNTTGTMSALDLAQGPFLVSWSAFKDGVFVGGTFVVGPNTLTDGPPVSQATKNIFVMGILIILGGTVAALKNSGLAILSITAASTLFMITGLLDPLVGTPVLLMGLVIGVMQLYKGRGQ